MKILFETYLRSLTPDHTEHSNRTAFQNLLQSLIDSIQPQLKAIHEPKRDLSGKGAPDFMIKNEQSQSVIGYIEVKKIGENLSKILKDAQIKKYQQLSENLILTDYLEFVWLYKDTEPKQVRICQVSDLENKKFKPDQTAIEAVKNLLLDFLQTKPQKIGRVKELAQKLSRPSLEIKKFLFEEISKQLKKQNESNRDELFGIFEVFEKNLFEGISAEIFADSFAQMLTYSIFLAKLNAKADEKISLNNIQDYIPESFHLIKALADFFKPLKKGKYQQIRWAVEMIFSTVNNLELAEIIRDLNFKQKTTDEKDPYVYFYEDFLREYDQELRVDRGVYYTPPAVVRFIVSAVDEILEKEFSLENGLANKSVKCLDFACGTGTFLLEIFKKILTKFEQNSFRREEIFQYHLLKNIFGFELLISPYAISHLKLSQFLKEEGFNLSSSDQNRIQIYLTNTLEDRSEKWQRQTEFDYLNKAIAEEGKEAQKIKDDQSIIAILGNPPYNVSSQNPSKDEKGQLTPIGELLEDYKPDDETKINIDDDYIKFIRFAHDKISKNGRGVIGIITNNSFLNGITHRKMRGALLKDFSAIYILNLHGNSNIGETAPDGLKDENVFDIKQGTAISIFVKNPSHKDDCRVFYRDFWGKREAKLQEILASELTDNLQNFTQINYQAFNQEFRKTRWGRKESARAVDLFDQNRLQSASNKKSKKKAEGGRQKRSSFADDLNFFTPIKNLKPIAKYGDAWGIHEIFREYNSGVETQSDGTLISFSENEFLKKIENFDQKFVKNISYRPFDVRKIYYDPKLVKRDRISIMRHFLGEENFGLCFTRQIVSDSWQHIVIANQLVERCSVSIKTRECTYIAPLYLTHPTRQENFTKEFRNFIDQKYPQKFSAQAILAYVYGILHCPSYRQNYLEFLKIDFPRIPFADDAETFQKISEIGLDLINAHLLKKIPTSNIGGACCNSNPKNYLCQKPVFDQSKQRLYFNQSAYFAGVSAENLGIQNWRLSGARQVFERAKRKRINLC